MQGLLRIPHRSLKQASSTVEAVFQVQPQTQETPFAALIPTINARLSSQLGPGGIALSALTAISKQGVPGNGLCEAGELTTVLPLSPNAGITSPHLIRPSSLTPVGCAPSIAAAVHRCC